MKKILKGLTGTFATLLFLTACTTQTTTDKVVGKVNNRNIIVPYYKQIFPTEENTSTNNSTTENSTTNTQSQNQETTYNKQTALLLTLLSTVFEETGNATFKTKELNNALSQQKATNGNDYLKKAEETYSLPIKNEKDFQTILKFSFIYNNYLKEIANITDDKIKKQYEDKHETQYCSSHILIEDQKQADAVLKEIKDGKKDFQYYVDKAYDIELEKFEKNSQNNPDAPKPDKTKINANDVTIDKIKFKQISYLDCKPASDFEKEFADALKSMKEKSVSQELVKTKFGYHIIDLDSIKKQTLTEELKATIKNELVQQKTGDSNYTSYKFNQLLSTVKIEITDPEYKKVYDEYLKILTDAAKEYQPTEEDKAAEKKLQASKTENAPKEQTTNNNKSENNVTKEQTTNNKSSEQTPTKKQ